MPHPISVGHVFDISWSSEYKSMRVWWWLEVSWEWLDEEFSFPTQKKDYQLLTMAINDSDFKTG